MAVPRVCLVALGENCAAAWGLPSLPGLIKQQKLATAGGALPPPCGPTQDRAAVTVMVILFLFLPLGAQKQKETLALQPRYGE